jgi:Ca-activated chloride channel family protein
MDFQTVKVSRAALGIACGVPEKALRLFTGGQIMRSRIRVGLLVLGVFLCTDAQVIFSQNQPPAPRPDGWQGSRPDDWQGTKPAPQGETRLPAPQRSTPSGKQVLEIPSQSQERSEPPRRQADLPSHMQGEALHPEQLITVTVTDPQGRYVSGLQAGDFDVYEDDEPQKVTYFNTGEKEPLSMGMLIDTSGSMTTKIERARFALHRLIEAIRTRDEVFIEAFSTQPRLLQDFTDSRILLTQATAYLRPNGGTALYDAILDGLRHVRQGRNAKKTLVIISDGDDMNSYSSLDQAISAARRAGVLVYAIGITDRNGGVGVQIVPFSLGGSSGAGGGFGARILHDITTETGGTLFTMNERDVIANEPVIDQAIQTISRELRSQYSLGYAPTRSGSHYRHLRVEARSKEAGQLTTRTQQGYARDSQEPEEKTRQIFRN